MAAMVGRTAPPSTESGDRLAGRVRSAVYGTIIAMSVLAYLGDQDPGPWVTAVTVGGTGIVIFLAEAYAEVVGQAFSGTAASSAHEVRAALRAPGSASAGRASASRRRPPGACSGASSRCS